MTEEERTLIRRHCGYSNLSASEGVNALQQYGLLEYRLAHLTEAEKKVVRHYLQTLASLENDTPPDTKLISGWKRRLCAFVGVAAGPAIDARVDEAAVEDRALDISIRNGNARWPAYSDEYKERCRYEARAELAAEAKAAPQQPSYDDLLLAKAKDLLWETYLDSHTATRYLERARAALAPKPAVPQTVEEIERALSGIIAPGFETSSRVAEMVHGWLVAAKVDAP